MENQYVLQLYERDEDGLTTKDEAIFYRFNIGDYLTTSYRLEYAYVFTDKERADAVVAFLRERYNSFDYHLLPVKESRLEESGAYTALTLKFLPVSD